MSPVHIFIGGPIHGKQGHVSSWPHRPPIPAKSKTRTFGGLSGGAPAPPIDPSGFYVEDEHDERFAIWTTDPSYLEQIPVAQAA